MLIIKQITDLQKVLAKSEGNIGFVPTMGALHQGHISLINKAKQANKCVVCSIFVNPTQFNDKNDYAKYPITLDSDIEKLILIGTDILFLPSVAEMYPNGLEEQETYPIGYLDTILDGKFRPGHFNGVSQIVHKLLLATRPSHLYMGEKDFQQCLVVKQLIHQFNIPVQLVICPTLREHDGLAMSSRNMRLTTEERKQANEIYKGLVFIQDNKNQVEFENLKNTVWTLLENAKFIPEYIVLADADTLEILDSFNHTKKMVVLVAAKLGNIRLIDNMRM